MACIALTVWLGYGVGQAEFGKIIAGYSAFFVLFLFVCYKPEAKDLTFWIGLGILLRMLLLFSFPNLSDDIYRFVWDGRLINHGFNPFDRLPGYYIENDLLPEVLTPELYAALNSRDYYTIYPPVLQAIFAFATWLFPQSVAASAVVMKAFLLLGEIGTIWLMVKLLRKLALPVSNVLFYALSPLVIVEIMGNVHFEGLMIFFLLLGLWLLVRNSSPGLKPGGMAYGGMAMAGAIASKLLPLMFLPFLIGKLGWRRSIIFFGIIGGVLLLLFAPLLSGLFLHNFGSSLDLYFRRFEFNASFFYVIEWLYRVVWNDHYVIRSVGPNLALITLSCIIIMAIVRHDWSWRHLPESWLFAISIYLLLTTTVHPWYICLPVALSIFTKWRYPLAWSGAVVLSYSHYWGGGFQERFGLIALEYMILIGFFMYEAFYLRKFIIPKQRVS